MSQQFRGIPQELKKTDFSKIFLSTTFLFGGYLLVFSILESAKSDYFYILIDSTAGFVSEAQVFLPGINDISRQLSEKGYSSRIPYVSHMIVASCVFSILSVSIQILMSGKIANTLNNKHQFYFVKKYGWMILLICTIPMYYQVSFYMNGIILETNNGSDFNIYSNNDDILYKVTSFIVTFQFFYLFLSLYVCLIYRIVFKK